MKVADLQPLANEYNSILTHGKVVVLQNESHLPTGTTRLNHVTLRNGRSLAGAYIRNSRAYIIADSIKDIPSARATIEHELSHLAAEELMDSNEYKFAIRSVQAMDKVGNQVVRQLARRVDANQPELSDRDSIYYNMEKRAKEIIAMSVETGEYKDVSLLERAVNNVSRKFKSLLRGWGVNNDWVNTYNEKEIFSLLMETQGKLYAGKIQPRAERSPTPDGFILNRRSDLGLTEQFTSINYRQSIIDWAKLKWGSQTAPDGSPVWQNFTQWFGASPVVNSRGEPLVTYHGTTAEFEEFKNKFTEKTWEMFSDSSEYSNNFASGRGGRVIPSYLALNNPLDLSILPAIRGDARVKLLDLLNRQGVDTSTLSKTLPYERDLYQIVNMAGHHTDFAQQIIDAGFDGIILPDNYDEKIATTFVALHPGQIKSALGNDGAFSPESDNILHATEQKSFIYSALTRAIESAPDKVFNQPATQVSVWIKANQSKLSIKTEEIVWSGVQEYLQILGRERITKAHLLAYLAQNGVQIQEKLLGDTASEKLIEKAFSDEGWRFSITYNFIDGKCNIHIYDKEGNPVDHKNEVVFPESLQLKLKAFENNDTEQGIRMPKHGKWQFGGGKNYRELLLTLPSSNNLRERESLELKIKTQKEVVRQTFTYSQKNPECATEMEKRRYDAEDKLTELENELESMGGQVKDFVTQHYSGYHNVLAHVRFNERTSSDGQRLLFIEEIQSDWGQNGKKHGFKNYALYEEKQKELSEAVAEMHEIMNMVGNEVPDFGTRFQSCDDLANAIHCGENLKAKYRLTQEQDLDLFFAERTIDRIRREGDTAKGAIPTAPFVTDTKAWTALALKRMIRYAVDSGFDAIAWTTGEQQCARFNIGNHLQSVDYMQNKDGSYHIIGHTAEINNAIRQDVPESELDSIVGKEIALKIISGEGDKITDNLRSLSNLDFRVGGEGMNEYYDHIVPQVANDILKKFWAKTNIIQIGGDELSYDEIQLMLQDFDKHPVGSDTRHDLRKKQEVATDYGHDAHSGYHHGFKITPEMAASIRNDGLPLFSKVQVEMLLIDEYPPATPCC